ncbi:MAG TPA: glycosyltransferase [Luteibaculaceae bacterium]|nr:glycosyltransferase [Luteibaculaceae bacterium]
MHHKPYTIIVPVYNRPEEMRDLLQSLAEQTEQSFELLVIEDGSSLSSESVVAEYNHLFPIQYHFKPNSGPGDSRNVGMSLAQGEWLLFFDSDCVIPKTYFSNLTGALAERPLDAFGGPDAADERFSDIQKAINYAMTSVLTTGGVRGKANALDEFQPRSFNMGMRKEVYNRVGGFSDIHPGEDPDLSYRIMQAGFRVGLIENAFVYHKRRIDFKKFAKQVYKFGVTRVILMKWYPSKTKVTYFFPALFTLGTASLLALMLLGFTAAGFPLALLAIILFFDALRSTKNPAIAVMAVGASFLQLLSYGWGFIRSYFHIKLLGRPEREVFPGFFFQR